MAGDLLKCHPRLNPIKSSVFLFAKNNNAFVLYLPFSAWGWHIRLLKELVALKVLELERNKCYNNYVHNYVQNEVITMTQFLNLTEVRNRFPKIIHQVERGDQVIITRHGKPTAIIIKLDPNILETNAILKDKEMMKKIRSAKEDIKAGRLYSYQDVFGDK